MDSEKAAPSGYAPGYSTARMNLQRYRRAATQAAFLLPFLRHEPRVLDCGCGAGSITNDFAALSPAGFAIGIDIEATQCRAARRAARDEGIRNAFYETQDVLDLEFSDSTFDVVFAHALLDHLPEPGSAIAQMMRVLKPGGIIALRSGAWTGLRMMPTCLAAERCVANYVARVRASGGSPAVGEELGSLLEAAGARDIRLTTSYETYSHPVLFADALRAALRTPGGRLEKQSGANDDDGCDALWDWAQNRDSTVAESWKEAVATKSTA